MTSTGLQKVYIIIGVLLILTSSNLLFADVTVLSVTNSPDTTNYYAQYQITGSTGNGNTNLDANTDSIIVVFNGSTTVPASIDPSLITVNSTQVNVVNISGNRLAILTPVSIAKNGGVFVVVIDVNADIRNPSAAGSYTLQVATSKETTLVTSPTYSIFQSISTVTAAAVSPNPSVEGLAAAYTIGFDVGSGGFLTSGQSTITVVFPSETFVPNGALSGVTVNSTSASATADNDTVFITSPVGVDNNGSVQLNFAIGTGLLNPTTNGTYTLAVKTSSEDTLIDSDSYSISPANQLSISAITAKPDTVNEGGEFQFDFVTGSSGGMTANVDTIVVMFQQNTFIPSSISTSNVTVSSGGFSDNAASVIVNKTNATDDDSIFVVTPISIEDESSVTLKLSSSAGYLNPSVAGNYKLKLRTSQDTTVVESNPYSIVSTQTTISQANVTPTDNSTGATTSYTVNFSLGDFGRLKSGESTITLTFNSLYGISETDGDYDASQLIVGGTDNYPLAGGTDITADNTAKTIVVTIPANADINNGVNISLVFGGSTTDPITNPTAAGNYLLGVKTSVETTNVNSASYNIGGTSITVNSVTLSDATVNNSSQYTFNITTVTRLRATANDYIKIIFPEGTTLPTTIATTNMTISGANPASISVNQSASSVTANVSQNNLNAGTFNVIILNAAAIINPIVPSASFYTVTMNTSQDLSPSISPAYAITGDNTQVTAVSATATPDVISRANVAYTVNFTTTATGKISGGAAAGSSTITMDFDSGTSVPATITASAVEINSNPSQTVNVLTSGTGGIVEVVMPNGLTIDNSTAVTVDFDTSAGLDNLTQETNTISVVTSSDTLAGTGGYTLSTSSELSVTSASPNPTTQNANASYSVNFTLGDPDGALTSGVDSIRVIFPSNTFVPATVSLSDVTVNGVNPAANPRVGSGATSDTLIIPVPQDLNAGVSVTVLINQSAGILNPTLVQSYTLEVGTTAEEGPYSSPAYNITQTSTTVTAATVTVDTPTPSSTSTYTVDFNVGSSGRLIGGTSTITITFNASTTVDPTAANYDNTSITVDAVSTAIPTTDISISGQAVTLTVPSTVSISNNESVSISLDRTIATKPITNPSTSGDYTLQVRTSVETSDITSNSYTISSDSPVTNISVNLGSNTVNDGSAVTVNFRVQNDLTAGSGTITITFQSNTFIPSSIATSNAQIASDASNPVTFNNADGVSTNPSTRVVTVTVPTAQGITAGDSVRVNLTLAAGIENPSITGNYTVNVKTSSQTLDGTSSTYNLTATTTTIQGLTVDITPVTPSEIGQYQYDFTTGIRGRLVSGTSTITLLIPTEVVFTLGTPTPAKVTVNSTTADAVVLNEGDPHQLIITVPSSVTIGNSANVTVIIDESAGLQNAPTTDPLTYSAYTSVESTSQGTDFSLPVELSSFQSEAVNNAIVLTWVTESELENAYWWILRKEVSKDEYNRLLNGSLNIEETDNQFETISQVEGRGNTSAKSYYNYQDNTVDVGNIYAYRLVDVSYSGLTTYHDVIYQEVKAPLRFALEQNFPNPFNPSTNIKYSIPVDANVELKIFNILGQEVKTLVNQISKAGFYNIEWSGTDNFNQRVASGIYIYSFKAISLNGEQNFNQMKKMIMIK